MIIDMNTCPSLRKMIFECLNNKHFNHPQAIKTFIDVTLQTFSPNTIKKVTHIEFFIRFHHIHDMQVEIRAGFIMMYRKIISLQIYINLRKVAKREYLIITMRKCVLCKNMIAFPVKTQTSLSWFVWRENMKI